MKSSISPGNNEHHEPSNTVFVASVPFSSPRFADKFRSAARCSASSNTVSFQPKQNYINRNHSPSDQFDNRRDNSRVRCISLGCPPRTHATDQLQQHVTSRSSLAAQSLVGRATHAYDYTAGDLSPYATMPSSVLRSTGA